MNLSAFKAPHLLIIEDEPAIGKTLQRVLQKGGAQTEWVTTGKDAIQRVLECANPFDVLLIDLNLPDMNGLEVFRQVKSFCPSLDAIMMTGNVDTPTAIASLNEGVFAYIVKPYNLDEVKANLVRLLEKQHLLRENSVLVKRLLTANSDLENKIRERTADLEQSNERLAGANAQLQRADKVKSDFITMVSHEMRTPLTVIIGCAKMLVAFGEKLDRPMLFKYLTLIVQDGDRLSRLAESVMHLSEFERQGIQVHPSTFDLEALIKELIEEFRLVSNRRIFELRFLGPVNQVCSDRDRIAQILMNLMANAAKYNPDDEVIKIEVLDSGRDTQISVIDTGPGIPESHRDRLFTPFFRTQDAVNYKNPGAGLGLAITRSLIEAIGGRIWLQPTTKGSHFSVAFPKQLPLKAAA